MELSYKLFYVFTWWNIFSRKFFFLFNVSSIIIILYNYYFLVKSVNFQWETILLILILTEILFSYFFFWQFFLVFLGYFTDPVWYQKNQPNRMVNLSIEPAKWGWGPKNRDHFFYHRSTSAIWFKSDLPVVSSLLMLNLFILLILFFVNIFWISLIRRVFSLKDIPLTFYTYCISNFRQSVLFINSLLLLVASSFFFIYFRVPLEELIDKLDYDFDRFAMNKLNYIYAW